MHEPTSPILVGFILGIVASPLIAIIVFLLQDYQEGGP